MAIRRVLIEAPWTERGWGRVGLEEQDGLLTHCHLLAGDGYAAGADARREWSPLLQRAARRIEAYFTDAGAVFDLPLALDGTEFQRRVWEELVRVPLGQTVSYGELARRIDNPRAARAVGNAVGVNPLPLIVPCHRVIRTDGALGGYGDQSDHSLALKVYLLKHEGALKSPPPGAALYDVL